MCANIIKNLEDMMIREHKLRKQVVFSHDMTTFCIDSACIAIEGCSL